MERPKRLSAVLTQCVGAVLLVAVMTGVLLLGGGQPDRVLVVLGYLLPVGWSAARWGRWPCTCAGLAALLAGQFLFIPLRGIPALPGLAAWLLLAALLVGGNLLADRLQALVARAQDSVYEEYQAVFVHGLNAALAGRHTAEEVAAALASYLQRLLQAGLVEVQVQGGMPEVLVARSPADGRPDGAPDRIVLLAGEVGLAGEIRLWGGSYLPPEDSYLLRRLAAQGAGALARTPRSEATLHPNVPVLMESPASVNAGRPPAHGSGQPTAME